MRFNSAEHLTAWQTKGTFPAIHDAIWARIEAVQGRSFLDLGCCHGLLCARILQKWPDSFVMGVDSSASAIQSGQVAGVTARMERLAVGAKTLPELQELLESNRITVVIARRCLPEMFGSDLPAGKRFAEMLKTAGVREVVLQGRVAVPKPVNPLCTVQQEVELLAPHFEAAAMLGQVAHLKVQE